ncbi:hybrid sensor histidine kinase/response regulator [Candidatus Synechococcus calcipolaris G9]|uniref:histidine kinase n=1 Tax=Candidatus Synechococcus calcipolaris G9 TaxID=1497997 RepID=A0ABT6EZG7_9SYNE|nr:hybrid sensor histidine kinase/response regulator [Candidatus Synechococcus calcipolaris]MDG2991001.1 hybrid sensor histidine kinase/response regulator [Candidatus Synechococcus calcipolaris G9]
MYIEDDELRNLYQAASQEHLHNIEAGLLVLEKQPQDRGKLEELLRETHSLKGDSRMLGVTDAESLTHHIEEILTAVHNGEASFSPQVFDCLYEGVDAIKKVAQEAVTGTPSGVSVFHVSAQLLALIGSSSEGEDPAQIPDRGAEVAPDLTPEPTLFEADLGAIADFEQLLRDTTAQESEPRLPLPPPPEIPSPQEIVEEEYRFDTVRIEATKLDALMHHIGELSVTQQRIARQRIVIHTLNELWEEAQRQASQGQQFLGSDSSTVPLRQTYHQLQKQLDLIGQSLQQLVGNTQVDDSRLEVLADILETDVRNLQLLPFSSIFNLFPRTVRDLAKQQKKQVDFIVEGADNSVDRRILEEMKAPLTHLLRNAIDHGIESPEERLSQGKPAAATLILRGAIRGSEIVIEVTDDGRGLDLEAIKQTAIKRGLRTATELAMMTPSQIEALVFMPGFSTRSQVTEISGRGVGLDVVRANVERLKGTLTVTSRPQNGCTFRVTLRGNRATIPILVVRLGETYYGVPTDAVETSLLLTTDQMITIDGSPSIVWQGQPIGVSWLADILDHPHRDRLRQYPCMVLRQGEHYRGMIVDELIDCQDIQLKTQSKLLKRVPNLLGVTILSSGEICHILNPQDLIQVPGAHTSLERLSAEAIAKPNVLLVEDSLPIRTQLRRILEASGYAVTTAVDGMDGFHQLRAGEFDAVVSDVEMPNQSGIEMTEKIRRLSDYNKLPIILVTTLAADSDRQRAMNAGASAYLTKGDFDQTLLLNTLRNFIYGEN